MGEMCDAVVVVLGEGKDSKHKVLIKSRYRAILTGVHKNYLVYNGQHGPTQLPGLNSPSVDSFWPSFPPSGLVTVR